MTLSDIIVSALAQLDRGHDSQSMNVWRDRMTRFANEAVGDLAHTLRLRRTDSAEVSGGVLDISTLSRPCVKLIGVWRENKPLPAAMGPDGGHVRVAAGDGTVSVQYRYRPPDMTNPTDEPEVPEYCHGLIVTYVVARERATSDPSTQRGANVYFELYEAGKRALRPNLSEADASRFVNRW